MSVAFEILSELQRRGVSVRADGDFLKLRPVQRLDESLIKQVKTHKPGILAVLRNRPATCAASCYEIELGNWIHHPWAGCATVPSAKRADGAHSKCKHCDGKGECNCLACTLRRTEEAVPCLMCRPQERQAWLTATRPEGCWHCAGCGECTSCIESGTCRVCGGSTKPSVPRVN